MDAQRHPGQVSKVSSLLGLAPIHGEDHRRSTDAAMGPGIGSAPRSIAIAATSIDPPPSNPSRQIIALWADSSNAWGPSVAI